MIQLIKSLHLLSGAEDLAHIINFDLIGWQLQLINILLWQPKLLFVRFNELQFLLLGHLVALVNQHCAVLADALLLFILLEYCLDVNVQAHEPRETLLAHDALQLQVASHYVFFRQDLRVE